MLIVTSPVPPTQLSSPRYLKRLYSPILMHEKKERVYIAVSYVGYVRDGGEHLVYNQRNFSGHPIATRGTKKSASPALLQPLAPGQGRTYSTMPTPAHVINSSIDTLGWPQSIVQGGRRKNSEQQTDEQGEEQEGGQEAEEPEPPEVSKGTGKKRSKDEVKKKKSQYQG